MSYEVKKVMQELGGGRHDLGGNQPYEMQVLELNDTGILQFQSLCNFAKEIHYYWHWEKQHFMYFGVAKTSRPVVSFQTMVDYHNYNMKGCGAYWCTASSLDKTVLPYFAEKTNLTEEMLTAAISSKLVKQVKLHWSKQKREFVVNSHLVRYSKEKV